MSFIVLSFIVLIIKRYIMYKPYNNKAPTYRAKRIMYIIPFLEKT